MITDNAGDREWHAARDEALAALSDVPEWILSAARWEQVREAIANMTAAVSAASPDDLWQTTSVLELCGPLRVAVRLGDTPALPAPKAVRDQVAELVTDLKTDASRQAGGMPESGPGGPALAGRDTDQRLPSGS